MLTNTKLRKSIADMPEDFTLEELMDGLILLEKVDKGLSQSEANEVVSEADLEEELAKWFK